MNNEGQKQINATPFTFDVNFAAPKAPPPVQTILLTDHHAALVAAEERGRLAGLAEGEKGAQARLADEAKRVADATTNILLALDAERHQLERDSATLAFSIAKKLAACALDHFPLDTIESLINESLAPLRKAPHLVVRLHEKDVDAIEKTVSRLVREAGFEGRFIVLGEPDFKSGDCRIEWADGGIIRDVQAAETAIEQSFERYFSATDCRVKATLDTSAKREGSH